MKDRTTPRDPTATRPADVPDEHADLERETAFLADRVERMDWNDQHAKETTHAAMLALQRYARRPDDYANLSDAIEPAVEDVVAEESSTNPSAIATSTERTLAGIEIDTNDPTPLVAHLRSG